MSCILGVSEVTEPLSDSVVVLGFFDGVHKGHQALLELGVNLSKKRQCPLVAYSFDPHPVKILAPHIDVHLLMPVQERVRALEEVGAHIVILEPFTHAFSEISAEDWVKQYLIYRLGAKDIVVGFNFTYGRNREGNVEHLLRMGREQGVNVHVVEPVTVNGQTVSSTRIRTHLVNGEVKAASDCLGRPFVVLGNVVHGDARGRELGFPTANIQVENEIVPKNGVYITQVSGENETWSKRSVTNIGVRPTFSGLAKRFETHILDFSGDLYGKHVRVHFLDKVRDEMKFNGVGELVEQIRRDVETARHYKEP